MNPFDTEEKCYVRFSITNYGLTHEFNGEFDEYVTWPEVLDNIVKTLEAHYGYSFDLDVHAPSGTVGIHYRGKDDE